MQERHADTVPSRCCISALSRGSLASIGSVGRSKGSAAEGWLRDSTTTALKYTRKLRKTKDEHKRLKAREQNLSERVIAKVGECKQNKFAYSRSGLILSESQVRKDEHELARLQQKLLQVRESKQQCSTLESHLRVSNAKARTGRIVFAYFPNPPGGVRTLSRHTGTFHS